MKLWSQTVGGVKATHGELFSISVSLSFFPWSNINSTGSDRHTLSPPVLLNTHSQQHMCVLLRILITHEHPHTTMTEHKCKQAQKEESPSIVQLKRINWQSLPHMTSREWIHAQTKDWERITAHWSILLPAAARPDVLLGWLRWALRHSYLVAAALQAHPSPFPARCRCVSSTNSALINLITNRRIDPRPIYLSTKPLKLCKPLLSTPTAPWFTERKYSQ